MNLNQLWPQIKLRFLLSGFVAIFAGFLCSVSYAADSVGEPIHCSGHKYGDI